MADEKKPKAYEPTKKEKDFTPDWKTIPDHVKDVWVKEGPAPDKTVLVYYQVQNDSLKKSRP